MRMFPAITLMFVTSCATPPMTRSGSLSSYDGLAPTKGRQTKSQSQVNQQNVLAAKTVRILPTRFADGVGTDVSDKNRALIADVIDRTMCRGLSKRLDVVDAGGSADLTVQATITYVGTTSRAAAGASVVLNFVPSALGSIPFLNLRVPIGLGSLTIEAEALNQAGEQQAAIIWARGADSFRSTARVSEVGDAYQLASVFGGNFSELITTGRKPSGKLKVPKLPKIGGSEKDPACRAFGNSPGILGKVTENFGLPPGLTDKGARANVAAANKVDP